MKCAALNLVAAAVEGLGEHDRNVVAVQIDALKTAANCARDRYNEAPVKCALVPACMHGWHSLLFPTFLKMPERYTTRMVALVLYEGVRQLPSSGRWQ